MTKSEMMVKAHRMARQMVGNYSARLSLALRQLWNVAKRGSKEVKCMFKGIECTVNTETGAIIGNMFTVKNDLKRRCYAQWNAVKKQWFLVAGDKMTQESMIKSFVERNAV